MLGCVTGFLGSGKTLFLSLLAKCSPHRKIFTNFTLEIENVQIIDVTDLETIENGLLLIDEAYAWLESRLSSSAINRYLSKIVFQSRKKGMDIFISAQLHSSIDLRYRHLEDVRVCALGENPYKNAFEYLMIGWGKARTIYLPMEFARELFPIFDTFEYPETTPTVFEPKKYNATINRFIKEIKKDFGDTGKVSQRIIKDYLLEKGKYEPTIADGIYSRLKRQELTADKPNPA